MAETMLDVRGLKKSEAWAQLWPALTEGMLLPLDDRYKLLTAMAGDQAALQSRFMFLHDRVQQAAYSLLRIRVAFESDIGFVE